MRLCVSIVIFWLLLSCSLPATKFPAEIRGMAEALTITSILAE